MSNAATLDERYFEWLCNLVGAFSDRNPGASRVLLCEQLYITRFDGWLPNDHNRAEDGKELREEFLDETGTRANRMWRELECSMLEMLIGLSRRASYQSRKAPSWWFWKFMTHLSIRKYTDERYNDGIRIAIARVLDRVNDRTYYTDGQGGLFPLKNPRRDQTKVEIWYQMSAYLQEQDRP